MPKFTIEMTYTHVIEIEAEDAEKAEEMLDDEIAQEVVKLEDEGFLIFESGRIADEKGVNLGEWT